MIRDSIKYWIEEVDSSFFEEFAGHLSEEQRKEADKWISFWLKVEKNMKL